jgi:enoyl-CoA hydratase
MTTRTFADAYLSDFVSKDWEVLVKCRKPVIAAVAGYAVGGGCETALTCDMIVADETARFGQPKVGVGTIPGGGGTQRLARLVGKGKAMELCLTGRHIDAFEAHRLGISPGSCRPDRRWPTRCRQRASSPASLAP